MDLDPSLKSHTTASQFPNSLVGGVSSLSEGLIAVHHFEVLLLYSQRGNSLPLLETAGVIGSNVENTSDNKDDPVQKRAYCTSEAH